MNDIYRALVNWFMCVVVALSSVLVLFSHVVRAEPPDNADVSLAVPLIPDEVTLDGVTYTRDELVSAFLKSAISTYVPVNQGKFEDALIPPLRRIAETDDALQTAEGYRVQYPWLYEYMYRDKGMPRYAVINKWSNSAPVRIALGFPNDLEPYEWLRLPIKDKSQKIQGQASNMLVESVLYEQSVKKPDAKVVTMVEQEVKLVAQILSETTGLSVVFEGGRQEENLTHIAPIRIILTTEETAPPLKYGHKVVMASGGVSSLPNKKGLQFRGQLEQFYLPTAVHFTPYSNAQVDGYFLPNMDNTIGMSLCFVWQGHAPEMLKALVRECLLRSMGLPDATAQKTKGYLDLWNDQQRYPRGQKDPHIDTLSVRDSIIPQRFSEYDRYFLHLLYEPALKPGISPIEVYHTLMVSTTRQ